MSKTSRIVVVAASVLAVAAPSAGAAQRGKIVRSGVKAVTAAKKAPSTSLRAAPRVACNAAEYTLTPDATNVAAIKRATLCLLNAERAARGLRPLREHPRLSVAAQRHTVDMVSRQYFEHNSLDGSDVVDRVSRARYIHDNLSGWNVGENIGWGTGPLSTPQAMVEAWMDSPGHKENILTGEFRDIGLGVVAGVPRAGVQGAGATYTTDFGTRNS